MCSGDLRGTDGEGYGAAQRRRHGCRCTGVCPLARSVAWWPVIALRVGLRSGRAVQLAGHRRAQKWRRLRPRSHFPSFVCVCVFLRSFFPRQVGKNTLVLFGERGFGHDLGLL